MRRQWSRQHFVFLLPVTDKRCLMVPVFPHAFQYDPNLAGFAILLMGCGTILLS
jgi:hypothetical protein